MSKTEQKDDKDETTKKKTPINRNCSFDYKDPHKRTKNSSKNGPVIRFKTSFRNTVYDVMKKRGWKFTESDLDWDIHWAEREWMFEFFDHVHLENWQRVCHYRNDRELCRKDLMIKNIKRKKRQLEREKRYEEAKNYDICPTTYTLPADYALFAEEFKTSQSKNGGSSQMWIMKPTGKAQGRGIFLFSKLKEISKWKSENRWRPENSEVENYVVCRYISNPYLVGSKKFDIRLYALVTCFSPLTVYLHRRGFCRFGSVRYSSSTKSDDTNNLMMHLTNVAIQKHGDDYNQETGGKWDLRQLKLYMMSRHGIPVADKIFYDIQLIIIHSLLAVQPIMMNDKHCFELYGYDIMIDDQLKPWLIEVNASPSLTANTKEDYKLKFDMLNDMFDIIDMEKRLKGDEEQVGGFDLIYANNMMLSDQQCMYSSFLGCDVPPRRPAGQPQMSRRPKGANTSPSRPGTKDRRGSIKKGSGTGGGGGNVSVSAPTKKTSAATAKRRARKAKKRNNSNDGEEEEEEEE